MLLQPLEQLSEQLEPKLKKEDRIDLNNKQSTHNLFIVVLPFYRKSANSWYKNPNDIPDPRPMQPSIEWLKWRTQPIYPLQPPVSQNALFRQSLPTL